MSARVALGLVGLEVLGIVVGTRGIAARAHDILETLGRVHADRAGTRKVTLRVATRTLRRRALFAWLELALVDLLRGVVTTRLFAVRAVAAVAFFALLDDSVATKRSVVFFFCCCK